MDDKFVDKVIKISILIRLLSGRWLKNNFINLNIFFLLANRSINSNVEQYHLQGKVLDTFVFDICHHPWRDNLWFDAIVTDRK